MSCATVIWLDEVESTNSHLRTLATTDAPHGTTVAARTQTAGRGQRGNTWEAEPGRNLTFSMLLRPRHVRAAEQFAISMAVSVAIVGVLRRHLPEPQKVSVKWPNDIYVADRKICGILIENSLMVDRIAYSIVGVGLNVNQQRFLSDAPNPVSMVNIAGHEFQLSDLLGEAADEILSEVDRWDRTGGCDELLERYKLMLWRSAGDHPFRLPDGTRFQASVADVEPTGMLSLRLSDGSLRAFAFKEVAFVL